MSGTINEIWPCHEINPTKVYWDNQTYRMGMYTSQAKFDMSLDCVQAQASLVCF
jgi:hypothetical protein